MNRNTRIFRVASLCSAAALLLVLSGCVVAFGHKGGPGVSAYSKGDWIQKQARQENRERAIAHHVEHAIESDPLLGDADISFRLHNFTVFLDGKLYDLANYVHAIKVVRSVPGVQSVKSRIKLNVTEIHLDTPPD